MAGGSLSSRLCHSVCTHGWPSFSILLRQGLIGRHGAIVDDFAHPLFVDRHVDGLANFFVVKGLDANVHGHIAGMQLAAFDNQVGVFRIVFQIL